MHDRTSHLSSVNEAREESSAIKSLCGQNTTHTTHSTSTDQTGIWTPCTQAQPTIPSPEEFGWTMESGHWMPVWITLQRFQGHSVSSLNVPARVTA